MRISRTRSKARISALAASLLVVTACDRGTMAATPDAPSLRDDAGASIDRDASTPSDADAASADDAARPVPVACGSGGGSALGDLPSGETEHTRRIAALATGEWLALGSPAPDPVHGLARGRSWSAKMAFAEDLGGAFLFGEGVHGWSNGETGRYMDDLWLYDARAHRWIVAYPGFDTRNPADLVLDENGFVSDGTGPLPVATMVHGYEMVSYDSLRRRFLSMPCPGGYHREAIPQLDALTSMEGHRRSASPWMFDVDTMRWARTPAEEAPPSGFGDVLVYLPSRDETFFWHPTAAPDATRAWRYENDTGAWRRVDAAGPPPPFGIDPTAAYDPTRERIYIGGGSYPVTPEGESPLWIYDLATDTWIDPAPEGNPGGNSFATNIAVMHYDDAAGVVLVFRHGGDLERGVFAYDPAANRWSRVETSLPDWGNRSVNAFYDTCQNAHFFHVAHDSADDGEIYAYRHAAR